MEQCRILIVDDEPNIAEGIRVMIQRELPSVQIVGLARDGMEGYERALALHVDIVLADIRMPNLDGIGMIRQLLAAGCLARFVILTGYSDFSYAKSAIALGVRNYITKPVDKEELFLAIQKICREIQKEFEDTSERDRMKEALEKYRADTKEHALKQYLETFHTKRGGFALFLMEIGIELKGRKFCCAIFENSMETGEEGNDLFFRTVGEKAERCSGQDLELYVLRYTSSRAVLILGQLTEPGEKGIYHLMRRIQSETAGELGVQVAFGMGTVHDRQTLELSLKEADCALRYRVIRGGDAAVCYRDISEITGEMECIDQDDVKRMETYMDNMDKGGVRQVIEEIYRKLEKKQDLSPEYLQNISLNLILLGIRKMPYLQFGISEYLGKDIFSLENISKFRTIDQLKNWIINTLEGMNDLMVRNNMPERRDVVEEAKKYMRKNLSKNITLQDISEQFYINPYYFSQLFKKKTGDNYQNYLTRLRIDRAKKLLDETDLKIYEVCEMVGYTNNDHFNKIFQRIVGQKPREYRERNSVFGEE